MAVSAGVESGSGSGRPSWPVCLLTVAAVTLSSVSLLALYQIVALRAEVKELKSDISRRRGEGQEVRGHTEHISSRRSNPDPQQQSGFQKAFGRMRIRRTVSDTTVSQSFLQLLADGSRKTFRKALSSGSYTGIPWQAGLKRGEALDVEGDRIVVREEGLYFVYSQVYYMDSTFTMGHVVIRWKMNVVGNEDPDVHLFRCIQTMDSVYPFNTCYTGGIVKLDAGDYLELLIPRPTASVSLEGDSTFLGALKLA